jgi:hypothetical protein
MARYPTCKQCRGSERFHGRLVWTPGTKTLYTRGSIAEGHKFHRVGYLCLRCGSVVLESDKLGTYKDCREGTLEELQAGLDMKVHDMPLADALKKFKQLKLVLD